VNRQQMAAKQLDSDSETSEKVLASELSQSCRTIPDGRESERQHTDRPLRQKQNRRTSKNSMAAAASSTDGSHCDFNLQSGDLALCHIRSF